MALDLPEDLAFRTPPDIASRHQVRFAFDRLGKRLDRAWDAIGILNAESFAIGSNSGLTSNDDGELLVNAGDGILVTGNQVTVLALAPMTVQSGVVQLLYGDGLELSGSSLRVDIEGGLKYENGGIAFDGADFTTTTDLNNRFVLMSDASGNRLRAQATSIWFLSYGSPSFFPANTYTYVNLQFSTYTSSLGTAITRSDWNNTHHPEINAIFVRIIQFIQSVQATLNQVVFLLNSRGL